MYNADRCGKNAYHKKDAITALNKRREAGVILRVYQCPICSLWHLTHTEKNTFKKDVKWKKNIYGKNKIK